ncbi:MAG: hypothetical protein JRF59_07060 [Deltaproteobacteria bacterium]|nr:hypothetical protein [Deltaproteobacteria bacterium]MBW2103304.1 hypothetical protein [Deltaproteobacteria bacterium]MBW2347585.1 hypothetical protein [Deltaproteobacteria bacterium]RLB37069.1 MAG: hypothetical protein DRH20_08480 [Deltaproteobacteria bacterium]
MEALKIAERLRDSLPLMREWVEATLGAYADRAVPVLDEGFERLASVFPRALLRRAKAVVLEGKVPFPPLGSMGLPELAPMERMPIAGITYDNTFFVSRFHRTESLYFHEMVHVVQWQTLGVDRFLLAYGVGIFRFGYMDCPLEKTAYELQGDFDRGLCPGNIMERITAEADAVWKDVSTLFPSARPV